MGVCLERVERINSTPLLDQKAIDEPIKEYDVEFRNVGFAYENRDVIKNVSFRIPEKYNDRSRRFLRER